MCASCVLPSVASLTGRAVCTSLKGSLKRVNWQNVVYGWPHFNDLATLLRIDDLQCTSHVYREEQPVLICEAD